MTDDLVARLLEKARSGQAYGGVTLCEAADALEAQAEEIEKLRARIAELEAALKPFDGRLKVLETVPNAVKYATSTDIDIVHLRAARAKLKGERNDGD